MKILFIGDIIGNPGRSAFKAALPQLRVKHSPDLVVVNGENAAGGFGITEEIAQELFHLGAHVITTGNHVWDKKEAVEYLHRESRVLRPLNYPPGAPGRGYYIETLPNGARVAVVNVSGRVFMPTLDCPFRAMDAALLEIRKETNIIVIDFHAEATSEKVAFARYLDGRVSAVLGTHTHVQTADERVLPAGTAYITDAGMTGPVESVIGVKAEQIIGKFLTMMPTRYETATGECHVCGAVVEIDQATGLARGIERICVKQ